MKPIKLISSQKVFQENFERYCREYDHTKIYTAWVGNPAILDHIAFKAPRYSGSISCISFDQL